MPASRVVAISPLSDFSTPRALISKMCSLTEPLISDYTKKVFEPGCGSGNFLVEILSRRLAKTSARPEKSLIALSNLYSVELSEHYVLATRAKLFHLFRKTFSGQALDYRFWPLVDLFLTQNIIVGDLRGDLHDISLVDWKRQAPYVFRAETTTLASLIISREATK